MNYILNTLAIFGAVASIYTASLVIRDKLGFYSWWSIESRAKTLIKNIRIAKYTPDVIVGVGRSGAILGGILSGNLGIIPIAVIDREYIWKSGHREIVIIESLRPFFVKDKKVLLVDAAPHTGETCKKYEEVLAGMNPKEIRVASLFRTKNMIRIPDFYVKYEKTAKKMPWRFSKEFKEDFIQE